MTDDTCMCMQWETSKQGTFCSSSDVLLQREAAEDLRGKGVGAQVSPVLASAQHLLETFCQKASVHVSAYHRKSALCPRCSKSLSSTAPRKAFLKGSTKGRRAFPFRSAFAPRLRVGKALKGEQGFWQLWHAES